MGVYRGITQDNPTLQGGTAYSLNLVTPSIGGTALGATAAEINATADVSTRMVPAGATLNVTAALHAGRIIQLNTAAGSVCTLPAATGTGNVYTFVTSVIATSNSHVIKVANGTDVMSGSITVVDNADGTNTTFGTVAASDTITLNRSTTGSAKVGERINIIDVAAGFFSVTGTSIGTGGSEASPFSAGV
jgi:hypothetical protein